MGTLTTGKMAKASLPKGRKVLQGYAIASIETWNFFPIITPIFFQRSSVRLICLQSKSSLIKAGLIIYKVQQE